MSKKNQEVAVKEEAMLPVEGQALADWGDNSATAADIVIPKILLMQGTSKLVQDGKAHVGSAVSSLDSAVLGSPEKPFNVVPFHLVKYWTVSEKGPDGKYKYARKEPLTPANENRAWEETVNGKECKFEKTFDFYVMMEDDLTLPYILSMKSTSAKAAKELVTQIFVRNKMAGLVPAAKVIKVSIERVSKDDKKYAVYKTSVDKNTPPETLSTAYSWFKIVKAGQFKAHDVEEDEASSASTPAPSASYADVESQF